jgi:hypothetical protein
MRDESSFRLVPTGTPPESQTLSADISFPPPPKKLDADVQVESESPSQTSASFHLIHNNTKDAHSIKPDLYQMSYLPVKKKLFGTGHSAMSFYKVIRSEQQEARGPDFLSTEIPGSGDTAS